MHLEILVEEPSVESALSKILPRILPDHTFSIHAFSGKQDLLGKLPGRLRGYRRWLPKDTRIVVLVDKDCNDCLQLKSELEQQARRAGFATKSSPGSSGSFQVLNRIAVEELEAWFFGDVEALAEAYPRLPQTLAQQRGYRDPDHIAGGTWEKLERLLYRYGYYPTGMPKIEVAKAVSEKMDPARNRSHSFRVFRSGLLALVGAPDS
ncbi:MAG TPA: DUF4276 family protein [Armatimonadota bacterium]